MPITAREFDRVIGKFGFETREAGDLLAFLTVAGKRVVRTKRSRRGRGDLPQHHRIRQQLHLNEDQLRDAIACPLDRQGYLQILRNKGIL